MKIFCKECSDWGNDTRCENCTSIFYGILMDPLDTCSHFNKKKPEVDYNDKWNDYQKLRKEGLVK